MPATDSAAVDRVRFRNLSSMPGLEELYPMMMRPPARFAAAVAAPTALVFCALIQSLDPSGILEA